MDGLYFSSSLSDGIIRKVKTASCAAPMVPIEKKSGDIRICGDFRVTYNKCSSPTVYHGSYILRAMKLSVYTRERTQSRPICGAVMG